MKGYSGTEGTPGRAAAALRPKYAYIPSAKHTLKNITCTMRALRGMKQRSSNTEHTERRHIESWFGPGSVQVRQACDKPRITPWLHQYNT